ncbi:helix-turn-helix domain-containing protein [Streptomyces sp. XM4193]|uniref:helix-turn-helix domain-containing protein n=1 Tax=Streptomyces sp. XM4193 TaxID=2929782 RepID=UPI001FF97907|nr:helix-turn-helix transcriptional regulator [Streptomyces sp. XM4193]MCK1795283.1 helix-turn-helix domain-containing protein [Streptomyces sp. XM4193]
MGAEEFTRRLGELKERSGLSYGALAKRLHMSTSTVHRYVNGGAVPQEFAPVERLARVCRATPEEVVELHRLWILADAARGRAGSEGTAPAPEPTRGDPKPGATSADSASSGSASSGSASSGSASPGNASSGSASGTAGSSGPSAPAAQTSDGKSAEAPVGPAAGGAAQVASSADRGEPGKPAGSREGAPPAGAAATGTGASVPDGDVPDGDVPDGSAPDGELDVVGDAPAGSTTGPRDRRRARRRRLALGCGAATVVGALVLGLAWVGGDTGGGSEDTSGAAAGGSGAQRPSDQRTDDSAKKPGGEQSEDEPSKQPEDGPDESQQSQPGDGNADRPDAGGVPVTARVRPYVYETPCSQHFLVDREPQQLPKPPDESGAPSWVTAFGAVPAEQQLVEVTLQGTGEQTVVLEAARVRVAGARAPLAWNEYATGIGCGGEVRTRAFSVDLDSARPEPVPANGQRDFPYKVSESDPEVFLFKADVQKQDVSWYLELEWSSGGRHGVLRVDAAGKPFRTSGTGGKTEYRWPPGYEDGWQPAPDY